MINKLNKRYFLYFVFAFFFTTKAFSQNEVFLEKNEIDENIISMLKQQKIYNEKTEIQHLWFVDSRKTNEWSNLKIFNFCYFTKESILTYLKISSPYKNEIYFNKILDISIEIVDSTKNLGQIIITEKDTSYYDDGFKKNLFFTNKHKLHPVVDFKRSLFYKDMIKYWKLSSNYSEMTKTYDEYFDENGDRKPDNNNFSIDSLGYKKLLDLKPMVEPYVDEIIVEAGEILSDLYAVQDEYIFKISYVHKRRKYLVDKLEMKPLPKSVNEIRDAFMTYRVSSFEKNENDIYVIKEFPYSYFDFTFVNKFSSEESDPKDIINKYFK